MSWRRVTPLRLFNPGTDAARLAFTRIGDAGRRGIFRMPFSSVTGQPVFHFERPTDARGWSPGDYTASLVIKDRIDARAAVARRCGRAAGCGCAAWGRVRSCTSP